MIEFDRAADRQEIKDVKFRWYIRRNLKERRAARARISQIRRLMGSFSLMLAFCLVIGMAGFRAEADSADRELQKYYTSVQLEKDDTLWDMAQRYNRSGMKSDRDYMNELRDMNHIAESRIHAGHYLTVSYYR